MSWKPKLFGPKIFDERQKVLFVSGHRWSGKTRYIRAVVKLHESQGHTVKIFKPKP